VHIGLENALAVEVTNLLLDIDYILLGMPGIAISLCAQWRIISSYSAAARMPLSSHLRGAEVAQRLVRACGESTVQIMPAAGQLCNHYDPGRKVLRLSHGVYGGQSLAALGIAAHEAGHAIQQASRHPGLMIRDMIVPTASLGSIAFWLLILAGLFLGMFRLIIWGLALFSLLVLVQLLNLPIELDASRVARGKLLAAGLMSEEQDPVISRVMNAAAWTYVAAILTSATKPLHGVLPFRTLFEFGESLPAQPSD
jgi:Zn-dependent membrane protease YugP